jgi:hypothetical protein
MSTTTNAAAAHSRATLLTAVTIVFLTTAWLAVLARTWVRAVMIRNYGWDDAVMLLALVCQLVVVKSLDPFTDVIRIAAHIYDLLRFQPTARLMGFWQLAPCFAGSSIYRESRFGRSSPNASHSRCDPASFHFHRYLTTTTRPSR